MAYQFLLLLKFDKFNQSMYIFTLFLKFRVECFDFDKLSTCLEAILL